MNSANTLLVKELKMKKQSLEFSIRQKIMFISVLSFILTTNYNISFFFTVIISYITISFIEVIFSV